MEYTVAKIIKEVEVEGRYGMQTRTAFTTNETGEKILSAFSKYPLKAGQKLEGQVTETEKDGKTYHNFSFAKKTAGGLSDGDKTLLQKIYQEVYATRQEQVMIRQLLQEKGILPVSKSPAGNEFAPQDEYPNDINPEDIPF